MLEPGNDSCAAPLYDHSHVLVLLPSILKEKSSFYALNWLLSFIVAIVGCVQPVLRRHSVAITFIYNCLALGTFIADRHGREGKFSAGVRIFPNSFEWPRVAGGVTMSLLTDWIVIVNYI